MNSQVFAITHTENMILARVDATDEAYSEYIRHYIQKNFKFFIHLKESILIFPKNEDRKKRQFFASCLLDNFNKTRSEKVFFEFNPNVPFFVEFAQSKEGFNAGKIVVKCRNDSVFFRFSDETKRIVELLKKSFFGAKVDVDYHQNIAKVKVSSKEGYIALRKLLEKNIKFSDFLQVKFTYNEEELIQLNSFSKYSKNSFFTDSSERLKEAYFGELNSKKTDSMESIRQKYLELIKIYHPDRVYGKDEETVKRYTIKFRRVQNAFEQVKKIKLTSYRA